MSEQEILKMLKTDLDNPGSYKSGEYLEDQAYIHLVKVLKTDREGIISALRYFMELRSEPESMLAVRLAERLGIYEVIPNIIKIGEEIKRGEVFKEFYSFWIDKAVKTLSNNPEVQ